MPNDYAEAHWLFSYEFGFIRRGLVGTGFEGLQRLLFFAETETLLHITATAFLAAFFVLYFFLVILLVRRAGFSLLAVAIGAVFVSSPYIVMAGKLNGYFDNIIAMLAILACLLVHRGRIRLAAALLAMGVLVHENILLLGLPSALVFAFAHAAAKSGTASAGEFMRVCAKRYWLLVALPLLSALAIYASHQWLLDLAQVRDGLLRDIGQHGWIQGGGRHYAPNTLVRSFAAHWANEAPCFAMRLTDGFYWRRILPVLLAILVFFWHGSALARWRHWLFVLALASTLLPLALHAIAVDVERFWTYPVLATLLACLAFGKPVQSPRKLALQIPLGLILAFCLLVQNLTSYPLFYGDADRLRQLLGPNLELPFLPASPSVRIGNCSLKLEAL